MPRIFSLLTISLALASAPALAGSRPDPEVRLARALEGRIAGEPRDCINLRDIKSSQIIDRTAILYETSGGKLYVNRPRDAGSLDQWDVLVTDTHSSQLCSIDVVKLYNISLRAETGFVFLGDFVPYEKPRNRMR